MHLGARFGAWAQVSSRGHQSSSSTGSPRVRLYRTVEQAVGAIGEVSITVTKSQIAFGRRKRFAYLWRPGQYLRSDVPAVLSIALPYEVASPRFKQVAHPSPTVWMHHLELNLVDEID